MKISNKTLTGLSPNSLIQPNIPVTVTPEFLSPFATTPQQKAQNELDAKLKEIDSYFDLYKTNDYGLKSSLDYTPLQYTPLSDEEIKKYASDTLAEYKLLNVNSINNSASRTAADLAASKTGLEASAEKKQKEIDSYYDTAKQASSDDALRRGLARSSIIINKLNGLETGKTQAKTDVMQELFDNIAGIDNRLNELETARLNALDEFDIVYAAKLGAEIQKLNGERQNRLDDVLKYNNTLQSNAAQYALDYAKTDSSLNKDIFDQTATVADKDLVSKIMSSIYLKKIEAINEYLYSLSKKDALDELEKRKTYYLEQLGESRYRDMVEKQKMR